MVTELASTDVSNGGDARAFEGIVRTRWPAVMVSYEEAEAPKLN